MMSIIDEQRVDPRATQAISRVLPMTAGWFDDPDALHRMRYFDGDHWTEHVTHFGPTPCSGCG